MRNERHKIKFNGFKWETVPKIAYKEQDGNTTFCHVDRQNIISSKDGVDFDVRYFECGRGGYTTLEKHQHTHIVMVARGHGKVIIGDNIYNADPFDYFVIPEWHPHQLINTQDVPFGFFCSVNSKRDKFVLLTKEETGRLMENKEIKDNIKISEDYFAYNA